MDLYKTYKLMKQRAKRQPGNQLASKLSDTAREIFYQNGNQKAIRQKIQTIIALEKGLPLHLKHYGQEILNAFESGNYSMDRPYAIRHRFDGNIKTGLIYTMTSPARMGETKLGATTLSVRERAKCYKSKYGYPVEVENWKEVSKPFELEEAVAQKMSEFRVCRNTSGDSIEWYCLPEDQVWKVIANTLAEKLVNQL